MKEKGIAPDSVKAGEAKTSPDYKKDYKLKKVSIPEQLRNAEFRFNRLRGRTKIAADLEFQKENNYTYKEIEGETHLRNSGIIGGFGNLIIIDADREPLITVIKKKLPRTFTVGTPHEGTQSYYICEDGRESIRLDDVIIQANGERENIGDVQGAGKYVVTPGSYIFDCPKCDAKNRDIKGNYKDIECEKCGYKGEGVRKDYTVVDDAPIAKIRYGEILSVLQAYIKKQKSVDIEQILQGAAEGNRDNSLLRLVHFLRRSGDTKEKAYSICKTWNERNKPPAMLEYINDKIETAYRRAEPYNFLYTKDPETYKLNKDLTLTEKHPGKILSSKREKLINDTREILSVLHESYEFVAAEDTDTLYYYKDGVYEDAAILIKKEVERLFNDKNSTYFTREITDHLRRETYMPRDAFNADLTRIPLKNGLFNLESFEIEPFDNRRIYTFRIPITFNAGATCENLEAWIKEIVEEDSVKLLQEYCGYGFEPRLPLHKTLWLHGTGRNGKGAFMRLYLKAIGKENRGSLPLEQMSAKYRFSLIRLFGKFVNVSSEPQSNYTYRTETFKKLVGGDEVEGEIKGLQKTIAFTSFAKIFIMGNRYPSIDDDTIGFWERMEIVRFPKDFSKDFIADIEDKKIEEDGGEEIALSGFFNWCMEGLKRLKKNGYKLSASKSSEETRYEFQKVSNSIKAFIDEHTDLKPSEQTVTQPDLWNNYTEYCDDFGLEVQGKSAFTRNIGKLRGVHLKAVKIGEHKHKVWAGLKYNGERTMGQASLEEKVTKVPGVTISNIPPVRTIKIIKDKCYNKRDIEKGNFSNFGNPEEKPTKNINVDLVCECGEFFENRKGLNEHRKYCLAFHKKQTTEARTQQ